MEGVCRGPLNAVRHRGEEKEEEEGRRNVGRARCRPKDED
jgi:hypothetical protein